MILDIFSANTERINLVESWGKMKELDTDKDHFFHVASQRDHLEIVVISGTAKED